jgi:hypothetical protein
MLLNKMCTEPIKVSSVVISLRTKKYYPRTEYMHSSAMESQSTFNRNRLVDSENIERFNFFYNFCSFIYSYLNLGLMDKK